jgi:bisphosphoglycerate-independent phosphoglycerate mutase (AlkP superfamily)
MAAGLPFFAIEDLVARRAVYQEFTNELLIEKGFEAPIFEPAEAGEILAKSAMSYDFCLYEYFQTDGAGHSRSKDRALGEIRKLDEFLLALLRHTDLRKMSILITSDHGNIEDLSVATHTRNPVPVLLWGALARQAPRIKSILDIVPFVLEALKCA